MSGDVWGTASQLALVAALESGNVDVLDPGALATPWASIAALARRTPPDRGGAIEFARNIPSDWCTRAGLDRAWIEERFEESLGAFLDGAETTHELIDRARRAGERARWNQTADRLLPGGNGALKDRSEIGIQAARRERIMEMAGLAQSTTGESAINAPYIDWADFWTRDRSDSDWLVEDVIARARGHLLFARHKTGKSLVTLWLVLEAVRAGAVVIYLDYEMTEDDLHERLSDMGCGPETDLTRLRYALLPSLPALSTPAGGAALLDLVDAERARHPGREALVVVDTIGRAVTGAENDSDTIMAFYAHTGMPLKARSVAWLRLDHEGKEADRGPRGNSAKGDDVDVAWRLAATDSGLELRRYAARMSWIPEKVTLRKVERPYLRFERVAAAWPLGTVETAAHLERLGVDPGASTRVAADVLRGAGEGRRRAVVVAAQKYRRGPERNPGTTLGTTPANHPGNHPGNHREKSHNHGQEPPREPPGTTPGGRLGTTRGGTVGTPPGPSPTNDVLAEGDGFSIEIERGGR